MGASKTHQYDHSEILKARIANALGHPARIRIMNILKTHHFTRNVDLVSELKLTKSTVNNHLMKLQSAGLIQLDFDSNCYHIRPNAELTNVLPYYFSLN